MGNFKSSLPGAGSLAGVSGGKLCLVSTGKTGALISGPAISVLDLDFSSWNVLVEDELFWTWVVVPSCPLKKSKYLVNIFTKKLICDFFFFFDFLTDAYDKTRYTAQNL